MYLAIPEGFLKYKYSNVLLNLVKFAELTEHKYLRKKNLKPARFPCHLKLCINVQKAYLGILSKGDCV